MIRLLVGIVAMIWSTAGFAQWKIADPIYDFKCDAPSTCTLRCWNSGTLVEEKYNVLKVYQYKEHPTRIWYSINSIPHILGADATCNFGALPVTPIGGTPAGSSGTIPSSSLSGPKSGTVCIGDQPCVGPK
jgi:hypothetical protein